MVNTYRCNIYKGWTVCAFVCVNPKNITMDAALVVKSTMDELSLLNNVMDMAKEEQKPKEQM